jgi:hypothetical protein
VRPHLVLPAIALGGVLLRLVALAGPNGPLDMPGGYDDSVYFSASALLFRGVLPYRDFVFVHPPGVAYFFGLISAWPLDAATAFAAARVFATLIGAVNIVLVGRIAGPVAALLYAIYPEAIVAERGPYLECVLNLFCLLTALHTLRGEDKTGGAFCGAACATKVLGGIWLVAALVSGASRRFVFAAAIAGLVFLAPLALWDVPAFFEQTVLFHSMRPPDGIGEPLVRLREMLLGTHVVASSLALVALLSMFRQRTRELRFFATAYLLTIAALLLSKTYWYEYNSHLAASQCVLAGLGARVLMQMPGRRRIAAAVAIVLLFVLVDRRTLRQHISNSRTRAPEVLFAAAHIREFVPADDCVFSFDPSWTLAGGRLPPHGDGAPVIVDPYGAQLLAALRDGSRFRDAGSAFQSEASQRDIRARLAQCRFAIPGERGRWQMSGETRRWFDAHFRCEAGEPSLCVAAMSSPL